MLNLGLISEERAREILVNEAGCSEAFANSDIERYTLSSPGLCTAYLYGYSRFMALRTATEIALGSKFDRMAFHDFIVGQGLLPPDLLAAAVETEFIPAQRAK